MAPNPDITVTMTPDLIDALDELAERRGTDRSTEIAAAAMVWCNAAIEEDHLKQAQGWDVSEFHDSKMSLV